MYRSFSEADRTHLVNAFAGDLKTVKNPEIRSIIASFLYKADSEYGERVAGLAGVNLDEVKRLVKRYKE